MNARKSTGLTTADLDSLSAALAAGKRATVYLRDPMPSLDLASGTSARVMSIDGSTLMVSPKGVNDQLPFEADELQKSRIVATSTTPARPRSTTVTPTPSGTTKSPRSVAKEQKPELEPKPEPAKPIRTEQKPAPPTPARRPKAPAAVSVTITSVSESTWTVSVSHGSKRQGKPTEVTSDRVAKAMHLLGDESAITAVDALIESARAAAQKRIDELSHELEAARAVLAHLEVHVAED